MESSRSLESTVDHSSPKTGQTLFPSDQIVLAEAFSAAALPHAGHTAARPVMLKGCGTPSEARHGAPGSRTTERPPCRPPGSAPEGRATGSSKIQAKL